MRNNDGGSTYQGNPVHRDINPSREKRFSCNYIDFF